MTTTILPGDVLKTLQGITPGSIRCAITSPPYYGLRSYLKASDPLKQYEIGNEKTPDQYIENLVRVGRLVYRALSDDGTFWLNLGDSYSSKTKGTGGRGEKSPKQKTQPASYFEPIRLDPGLPEKNLLMIPARVAMALQADGWYLRSEIIWHKPNPMPESMKDRPTRSHEMIYMFSKSPRYYYDGVAIREPAEYPGDDRKARVKDDSKYQPNKYQPGEKVNGLRAGESKYDLDTRNKRDVWTVQTIPYAGAHYAVFPPALIEPCILAGTSAKGQCPKCGSPWVRKVEVEPKYIDLGFFPSCHCDAGDPVPDIVLDPFGGSGTVGEVATKHGRDSILCELNNDSIPLIHERLGKVQTVFNF